MNEYTENLTRVLREQGAKPLSLETADGFRLANDSIVGWRAPKSVTDSHTEAHLSARAIRVAAEAVGKVAKIDADARLSDSAKAADSEKVVVQAAADFSGVENEVTRRIAEFQNAETQLSVSPRARDAIEATEDSEVRAFVRSMTASEHIALAQDLLDGKQDRLLAALARSPLPLTGVLKQCVPDAWEAYMRRINPDGYRSVDEARERVEWMQTIVGQAKAALPKSRIPVSGIGAHYARA